MDNTDPFVAPVRLASSGVARFVGAAFLAFWLCGWFVGECVAGALWLAILIEWIAPGLLRELGVHGTPITGAGSIAIFAFLSVWLSFWTLGGIAAMDALLRSLWGSDEIRIESGRLVAIRRSGPFTSRHAFEQGDLRSLRLRRKDQALLAGDGRREVAIAELGTREQRTTLRDVLRAHLLNHAPADATVASTSAGSEGLPDGWRPDHDLEGRTRVARYYPGRSFWVVAAGLIAGLLIVGGAQILSQMTANNVLAPALRLFLLALLTLAVLAGGAWLQFGRSELVVSASRFGRLRRLGQWQHWTDFGAPRLRVEVRTDSDGDEWFELVAGAGPPRHVLLSIMNESNDPVTLGRWMANRLGITLEVDPRAVSG